MTRNTPYHVLSIIFATVLLLILMLLVFITYSISALVILGKSYDSIIGLDPYTTGVGVILFVLLCSLSMVLFIYAAMRIGEDMMPKIR